MGNDSRSGNGKQVNGSLKEAIGKITGDADVQAEGEVEKKAAEPQHNKPAGK